MEYYISYRVGILVIPPSTVSNETAAPARCETAAPAQRETADRRDVKPPLPALRRILTSAPVRGLRGRPIKRGERARTQGGWERMGGDGGDGGYYLSYRVRY